MQQVEAAGQELQRDDGDEDPCGLAAAAPDQLSGSKARSSWPPTFWIIFPPNRVS